MTLRSATHEALRAGYAFARLMLFIAVLPAAAASLLVLLN